MKDFDWKQLALNQTQMDGHLFQLLLLSLWQRQSQIVTRSPHPHSPGLSCLERVRHQVLDRIKKTGSNSNKLQ